MIVEKDGFTYEMRGTGWCVIKCGKLLNGVLNIPKSINGMLVTSIAEDVFSGITNLKKVEIPDCLEIIGYNAFKECMNLESVIFYKTDYTAKCIEINGHAFANCWSLKYFSSSAPLFLYAGVFYKCKKLARLNATVLHCSENTFARCEALETLAFEEDARWQYMPFVGCKNLKTVVFNGNISRSTIRNKQLMDALRGITIVVKSDFPQMELAYDGFAIKVV